MPVIIDAAILELVIKSLYLFRSARWAVALILLAALAAPGNAGIPVTNPDTVQINFVPVDNSSGGTALDGFVTTDIRLDFEGQLAGSQLIIELDSGSFYRDPEGAADGAFPSSLLFPIFPSLEFDTTIWGGFPGGGAIDLGGGPQAVFPINGGTRLDQAWNLAGSFAADRTDYLDIRLTWSDDASGNFNYLTSTTSAGIILHSGVIVNGRIVPEPSTSALFFITLALLLMRQALGASSCPGD